MHACKPSKHRVTSVASDVQIPCNLGATKWQPQYNTTPTIMKKRVALPHEAKTEKKRYANRAVGMKMCLLKQKIYIHVTKKMQQRTCKPKVMALP